MIHMLSFNIRFFRHSCLATVVLLFCFSGATASEPRVIDLFILAGQSNAVGFDALPKGLTLDPNDSRVLFWWKVGDPPADIHDSTSDNAWLTLQPQKKANPITPLNYETRQYGNFGSSAGGFGPEVGFARKLLEKHSDHYRGFPAFAILKVSYNGTSVENDWNPDQRHQEGNCFGAFVDQYRKANSAAKEMGITLRPSALLWVQGESDSDAERVQHYAKRLTKTIAGFREVTQSKGLPVRLAVNTKFKPNSGRQMEKIIEAQKSIAKEDANCEYIDSSSATIANDVHFDASGTLQVGEWFADSIPTGTPESTASSAAKGTEETPRRLKVLVAGGHPDDPETGCGGTIAKYTAKGHDVTILYLTTGEAGIEATSHEKAASIRRRESIRAAAVLSAKPRFFGQIDGDSIVNGEAYRKMLEILGEEKPDVVFTHWPIDTHRDHRVCTMLVYDAWVASNSQAPLYYYEVMSGSQTQTFQPTDFVDISEQLPIKHRACFLHVSQNIEEDYPNDHGRMEVFRGMQSQVNTAEAFVRQAPGSEGLLP